VKRIAIAALAAGALGVLCAQAPATDVLFKAMHDEMERAMKLTLANLEAPYFVEYVVADEESFTATASLGGVLSRRHERFRLPKITIRVGSYDFDNSNYTGSGFNFGTRYDLERFPLEDNYPLLRRYLWLLTDSAYKSSVEAISRKRAALRNMQQDNAIHDFAHAEPVKSIRPIHRLAIDEEQWINRVRSLSAIFNSHPDVRTSSIDFEASEGGFSLVNSEGSEVREPETVALIRARAAAQATDGMTVRDSVTFHGIGVARLPGDAELQRGVTALADNVEALAKAPKGEDYNGPILFEGMAGAQVFAEVLGRNLTVTRAPVGGGGRGGAPTPSDLEGRMGARVLPESFDVVDDPTQVEWRGRPLFGSYKVDAEGVVPAPLRLIEKGVLKGYLLTRQPVRGFEGSNGRARLPGGYGVSAPAVSNLFVSSRETAPVADLKKQLIELIRTRSKPYGILVRKMDFPSTAGLAEARSIASSQQVGRPVSLPVLVYRVYPDGREELVRGLRFRGFSARSLKDILAAGDDSNVFEWMENTAPFALVGGTAATIESCVVAPSILVDDLELHPIEGDSPKLPVVAPPDMTH
jgi:predicted Zn-dependent protease